jgi:DNA primase
VLFPIFDVAGDPVAFGGRLLDVDEGRGPKYVNTAETPIWHKGRALYALNWAKQAIVKEGFAVVVEGYTDVIACHQAGVAQAVATCGHRPAGRALQAARPVHGQGRAVVRCRRRRLDRGGARDP